MCLAEGIILFVYILISHVAYCVNVFIGFHCIMLCISKVSMHRFLLVFMISLQHSTALSQHLLRIRFAWCFNILLHNLICFLIAFCSSLWVMIPAVVVMEQPDYSVPSYLVYTIVYYRGAFINRLYLWRFDGDFCEVSLKELGLDPCALHGSWKVLTESADGLPGDMEIRFHVQAQFDKTWHTKMFARQPDSLTWTLSNTTHDEALVFALAQ